MLTTRSLFTTLTESPPTFAIILGISRGCSQRVKVPARLFVSVMQTHAAELWLPKQSRLWTWGRKHSVELPFAAAYPFYESFSAEMLLKGYRETVKHTFGKCWVTQCRQEPPLLLTDSNVLPISIFSKPSKLRRWYWLTLSASSS